MRKHDDFSFAKEATDFSDWIEIEYSGPLFLHKHGLSLHFKISRTFRNLQHPSIIPAISKDITLLCQ